MRAGEGARKDAARGCGVCCRLGAARWTWACSLAASYGRVRKLSPRPDFIRTRVAAFWPWKFGDHRSRPRVIIYQTAA